MSYTLVSNALQWCSKSFTVGRAQSGPLTALNECSIRAF